MKLPSLLLHRCVRTHDQVGLPQLFCAAAALSCCDRDVDAAVVRCWRTVNIWDPHGPKSTPRFCLFLIALRYMSRKINMVIVFSKIRQRRARKKKNWERFIFLFFKAQSNGILHVLFVIQERKQDDLEM